MTKGKNGVCTFLTLGAPSFFQLLSSWYQLPYDNEHLRSLQTSHYLVYQTFHLRSLQKLQHASQDSNVFQVTAQQVAYKSFVGYDLI